MKISRMVHRTLPTCRSLAWSSTTFVSGHLTIEHILSEIDSGIKMESNMFHPSVSSLLYWYCQALENRLIKHFSIGKIMNIICHKYVFFISN